MKRQRLERVLRRYPKKFSDIREEENDDYFLYYYDKGDNLRKMEMSLSMHQLQIVIKKTLLFEKFCLLATLFFYKSDLLELIFQKLFECAASCRLCEEIPRFVHSCDDCENINTVVCWACSGSCDLCNRSICTTGNLLECQCDETSYCDGCVRYLRCYLCKEEFIECDACAQRYYYEESEDNDPEEELYLCLNCYGAERREMRQPW